VMDKGVVTLATTIAPLMRENDYNADYTGCQFVDKA